MPTRLASARASSNPSEIGRLRPHPPSAFRVTACPASFFLEGLFGYPDVMSSRGTPMLTLTEITKSYSTLEIETLALDAASL